MARSTRARRYDRTRRDAEAGRTRQAVLDAVGRVLGGGIEKLTMPAVAREAGVSLPTVYRYFPDKRALLDAAAADVRERAGVPSYSPRSLAEIVAATRRVFASIPDRSAGSRVLTAARELGPVPADEVARRRRLSARGLRDDLRGVRGKDRAYLVDVATVLCSSSSAAAFARFGFGAVEAADRVGWVLETLLAGVRAREAARGRGTRR